MKLYKILSFVNLLLCLNSSSLFAQRSLRFTETNFRLKEAAKYIDMQYYQQAYLLLNDYLTHFRQEPRAMQEIDNQQAYYLYYLCALKLNKPFAEENFNTLLKETPFKQLRQMGSFQLAKCYFEQNQFEKAIINYESSGIEALTNKELTQRNFELGYSYLVTQRLEKVEPYFQSAKNIQGLYYKPGNYYHGLLSYYKKNYTEAKLSFDAVNDDARYKKIVPFYLTEIEYVTGNKEKALSDALQYLQSPDKLYYDVELNQMVAQIYCEQEDYKQAEIYYSKFISQIKSVRDDDYFKLAYCQYQQGKMEETIETLLKESSIQAKTIEQKSSAIDNDISQHSHYLLALCYLKNDNKNKAYEIFSKSKNQISDAKQKELIEYTLAKLSYDKADDKTAFSELNAFVKAYPNSEYYNEVNELLAYMNIKYDNFNDAIIAMNKLKNISLNLQKVYQKANYARGIQLLKDENPDRAIFNFQETKKFVIDETTVALADFWLAESNYRLGRHIEAMTYCDLFLNNADTNSMPDYTKKIHLTKSYIYLTNNENDKFIEEYVMGSGDTNTTDLLSRIGTTKANYIPEKVPVVDHTPYVLVYNLPEEKIDFIYKPIPLKPLAISNDVKREDQTNFLKLMIGNLSSLELGAGYNFDRLVKRPLYIDFSRTASQGKLDFQDVNQTHLGAYTNTEINQHDIDVSFEMDRNKQQYYGYKNSNVEYTLKDVKQVFQNIGAKARIVPLKENEYDIQYRADVYTGLYTDKFDAGEYSICVDAPISKQLKSDLVVHSDLVMDVNAYFVKGNDIQNNSLLSWRPSVIKQMNQLKIKTGLNVGLGKQFYFLPDVFLQYHLPKQSAIIELALLSNIRLNTFKQMTQLNPFIFNYYKVKQSKNTEITGSVKGTFSSKYHYFFRTGIAIYNNLPLFLNDTAGDNKQLNVLFEKQATAFLLDAAIDYTVNTEMLVGAKLNLRPLVNLYSNKEAWHYVPSSLAVYGKVRATKDVVLNVDIFLLAGSKSIEKNPLIANSYIKTLGPGLDMNIAARYIINKRWNAKIDANNLFGSNYQRWYGYPMYGTNVMLGVVHSFRSKSSQ